jgi:predicted TPR repeat methyltransferase
VNILLERAAAAESAGDADLALRFLDQASDLAPDYAEPWNRRANIAYDADDYTGAIAAIQETLKVGPAARRARSLPRRAGDPSQL